MVFIHQFLDDSHNQNVHRKSIKLDIFFEYISDRIYWWIKFNNAASCQWARTLNHTIYSNENENEIDYYDWITTKQKTSKEPKKNQIQLFFFLFDIEKGILIWLAPKAQIQFAHIQHPLKFSCHFQVFGSYRNWLRKIKWIHRSF